MSVLASFHLRRGDFVLEASMRLPASGVSVLFGPSGSGKTTLLRCMAGLEHDAAGQLNVNGELWHDSPNGLFVPPYRRALGMVFQEASLFPHLDVRRNLAYGFDRTPAPQRRVSWEQAIALLGVDHLLARQPDGLSGGERQRVAIARALLTSPRLLLMDEPLSALDMARKQEILPYLERLHREFDIPIVYVTHAIDEVSRLADYLVLLESGLVVAQGPLSETLSRLDLPASFDSEISVVLETRVASVDGHYQLARLAFAGGELLVPLGQGVGSQQVGQACRVRIHARDVSLSLQSQTAADADSSILNRLPAVVSAIAPALHPAHVLVRLDLAGTELVARITRLSLDSLKLRTGMPVLAQIKSVALL
ncbi:molybdenum ABC transporter ATP-binding protein [Chitinimonas sp.]|uniref:molybdenum ABC transporter ATP-binding protein n=1 Tax=Chitinimonas sp. TaxID=1934313 RepID=UPI002F92E1CA